MKKFLELSSWRTALGNLLPSAHGHQGGSRKAAIGSMLIMAMLFAACGDEDSSFAPRDNTVSDSDIVAESFDNLPVCSSMREGAAAYVKDEKTAYICTGGSWVPEEETSSSSSETTQSSSSITTATPCNVDGVNNCVTDSRDGKTYRTVKIGDQVWMAENLNYSDSVEYPHMIGNSRCYNDDSMFCLKVGRFYSWTAAMDFDSTWKNRTVAEGMIESPHKGICPDGWHLPTRAEWNTLAANAEYYNFQATKFENWTSADNALGFSVLPIGFVSNVGNFDNYSTSVRYWSATEEDCGSDDCGSAYSWRFDSQAMYEAAYGKVDAYPIRCVKN